MDTVQKSVREYLRVADIVIDLLKNNGDLSEHECKLLQAYNSRLQSFLVLRAVKRVQASPNGETK
jgi:hypothetical protein